MGILDNVIRMIYKYILVSDYFGLLNIHTRTVSNIGGKAKRVPICAFGDPVGNLLIRN
jgi:hypothetical protein